MCVLLLKYGPQDLAVKKEEWKLQQKNPQNFPPMIMKVFGITVNARKPCTKEQTERGDETEKDVRSGTT